ncbi:hypothetical protein ACFRFU_47345 [Streptomyces sp. NPDC056704]
MTAPIRTHPTAAPVSACRAERGADRTSPLLGRAEQAVEGE